MSPKRTEKYSFGGGKHLKNQDRNQQERFSLLDEKLEITMMKSETATEVETEKESYLIYDNGGRPFKVEIYDQPPRKYEARQIDEFRDDNESPDYKQVDIFALADAEEWEAYSDRKYSVLVDTFGQVEEVFIGKSNHSSEADGNSILLLGDTTCKMVNNTAIYTYTYVYIGSEIYTFETTDEIKRYYSKVGNSNVPYPVAVGKENVYFMLDKVYINPMEIFNEEDSYSLFYGNSHIEFGKLAKPIDDVHVIQERLT